MTRRTGHQGEKLLERQNSGTYLSALIINKNNDSDRTIDIKLSESGNCSILDRIASYNSSMHMAVVSSC